MLWCVGRDQMLIIGRQGGLFVYRKSDLEKEKKEAGKAIFGQPLEHTGFLVVAQGSRMAARPSGHMAAQARRHSICHSQVQNAWPLKRTDILSAAPLAQPRSARAHLCPPRAQPLSSLGHVWSMKRGFEQEGATVSSPIVMVWCGNDCMGF